MDRHNETLSAGSKELPSAGALMCLGGVIAGLGGLLFVCGPLASIKLGGAIFAHDDSGMGVVYVIAAAFISAGLGLALAVVGFLVGTAAPVGVKVVQCLTPKRDQEDEPELLPARALEWGRRLGYATDGVGLTDWQKPNGKIAPLRIAHVDELAGGTVRLVAQLPAGLTADAVEQKCEYLAVALASAGVTVERHPARADVVQLTILGQDDLTLQPVPAEQTPQLHAESGQDPMMPAPVGIYSDGTQATVPLWQSSLLVGGVSGSGKSVFVSLLLAHGALCRDVELWLIDPKVTEYAVFAPVAKRLVTGNDTDEVCALLDDLVAEMDRRYEHIAALGLDKLPPSTDWPLIMLAVDELQDLLMGATKKAGEEVGKRLSRLLNKGRAAGISPILATQRPTADVVPTYIREATLRRCAFRASNEAGSDVVLGSGEAKRGNDASRIGVEHKGRGLLLTDGNKARPFRAYFLERPALKAVVHRIAGIDGQALAAMPVGLSGDTKRAALDDWNSRELRPWPAGEDEH